MRACASLLLRHVGSFCCETTSTCVQVGHHQGVLGAGDAQPHTGVAHIHQLQPLLEADQTGLDMRQPQMLQADKFDVVVVVVARVSMTTYRYVFRLSHRCAGHVHVVPGASSSIASHTMSSCHVTTGVQPRWPFAASSGVVFKSHSVSNRMWSCVRVLVVLCAGLAVSSETAHRQCFIRVCMLLKHIFPKRIGLIKF